MASPIDTISIVSDDGDRKPVAVPSTFCCVQCRLLQSPATSCAECGASMIAPVELVRDLLHYRDLRVSNQRDWGLVTALVAGGSIVVPMLAPLALGSVGLLGLAKLVKLVRRRSIAGVPMPSTTPPPGATTLYGIARRFRTAVPSLVDGAPVLVEHAVVRDRRGAVLLRRSSAAPFLVEVDGRAPVLVTGTARMTPSNPLVVRRRVERGDPQLVRMGVPRDLAVAGDLEIASIRADGSILAVTGPLSDEPVAELAFHRDGGTSTVMRGTSGSPVLLSDPQLIAAAL